MIEQDAKTRVRVTIEFDVETYARVENDSWLGLLEIHCERAIEATEESFEFTWNGEAMTDFTTNIEVTGVRS